jgi:23S rRNA (cytidine1920-2'-O)/16S rRNA (cytidine1409-2'-O)-methyltransferase
VARKLGLAELLVERGLFEDAKTAGSWIMARKVRVFDEYVTKPGTRVPVDAAIEVVGLERPYASRGGEKLAGALDHFALSIEGAVVLDAGASTGGFTDCLLQRGAGQVYAVDVGFGQLRGKLAADPRVVARERTNIADLTREQFVRPLDLCVADLSYLSLEKSVPTLAALFEGAPLILHLVKPLFEGVREQHAEDAARLRQMLARVTGYGRPAGLAVRDVIASPILGSNGTVEFFALFTDAAGVGQARLGGRLDAAVDAALRVR